MKKNKLPLKSPAIKDTSYLLSSGILVTSGIIMNNSIEAKGQEIDGYYEDDLIVSEWE